MYDFVIRLFWRTLLIFRHFLAIITDTLNILAMHTCHIRYSFWYLHFFLIANNLNCTYYSIGPRVHYYICGWNGIPYFNIISKPLTRAEFTCTSLSYKIWDPNLQKLLNLLFIYFHIYPKIQSLLYMYTLYRGWRWSYVRDPNAQSIVSLMDGFEYLVTWAFYKND